MDYERGGTVPLKDTEKIMSSFKSGGTAYFGNRNETIGPNGGSNLTIFQLCNGAKVICIQ